MTDVWYNTDDNGSKIITWYDPDLDMYITQDENNVLHYTSVQDFIDSDGDYTRSTDDSDDYAEYLAANSGYKAASNVTVVNSKTFKRFTRNIFALVHGKVIYLPDTAKFHAEMVAQHLEFNDEDIAWHMIQDIDRGYVDYNKRFIDIYRGYGKVLPNLDNAATILLTMLNAEMITNSYILYFCGGTFGSTTVGTFLADYELKVKE